jgi:DNA-binding response OmpR family regulator
VEVTLVRWPLEEERRQRLHDERRPRLLLLEGDMSPPDSEDDLEDWIRVPARDEDVQARLVTLQRRASARLAFLPELDESGVVHVGREWVSLPPVEARMVARMLADWGQVVGREDMARAGWPDGAPGRNALDVHVLRLRRRLTRVGLVIRTVRSRGYVLELAGAEPVRRPRPA